MIDWKGEDLCPHDALWEIMNEKQTEPNKKPEAQAESVFAKEQTYGEKKHAFIFGTAINFWMNLVASAGFGFWVAHSTNEIKLPFLSNKVSPRQIQIDFGNWIEKRFFMQGIKDPAIRMERSQSMATLATLLTPGHLIMIPSVIVGARTKADIVEYYDRKHYGDEAMESPELKKHHEDIRAEDQPTLFGAVFSRAGSFLATQTVARLVGTPGNFINKMGVKSFRGMDPNAIDIGASLGQGMEKVAPDTIGKINKHFETNSYDWSASQRKDPEMGHLVKGPYNKAVDNFMRYMTADVLYTLVTSTTVHPILNFAKKYIPGLTYTPKLKTTPELHGLPTPLTAQRSPEIEPTEKHVEALEKIIPAATVSHISNESTISAKPERSALLGGA